MTTYNSRPRPKRFLDHVRGVFVNRYTKAALQGLAVVWALVDIMRTINAFSHFVDPSALSYLIDKIGAY